MPWVEKYRPTCFADIKGQSLAVQTLKGFIENFLSTSKFKKAIILHGPPGVGKTTLAHVAAKETNSEIFELNASDFRNKKKLNEVLRPAIEQRSLLKNKKIILIDEVDGIAGTDRGGLPELLRLIEKTVYPIIITANDIWDKKFSALRRKCEIVKLKEIDYRTIKDILICTLRKEKLFVNNDVLTSLAIKAKGDIRAALNDLQTIARKQDSTPAEIDERNKEVDIFNALRIIFKNKPSVELLGVFDSVNMPLDKILLWIEENIPAEYSGKELAKAYEALAKADVFKGRIYKQQYWRFLVYENILLSYGIAASKTNFDNREKFTSYKKPSRILKIWLHNQKTAKKKSIAEKYAKYAHVGIKRAMKEFPFVKILLQNSAAQKEIKLNEEEIEYLVR